MEEHPVILFDGSCGLCTRAVRFVLRHDPRGRFRFAALQSDTGRRLLEEAGRLPPDTDSVMLIEPGRLFIRSTAALRIARGLSGPWPLWYILIVVPRPLRDAVYRFVARRRTRWFGRPAYCPVPAPEWKERFLA